MQLSLNMLELSMETSFKKVAYQLGLVDNDDKCDVYLVEARLYQIPLQFKQLFVSILIYC